MPKVVALFENPAVAEFNKAPSVVRTVKLTKRVADSVKPHAVRELLVWDTELKGFGLRTLPSGIKTYVLQYRNSGGRTRKLALGRHGVLTAEEARTLARQHLAAVKKGGDPSAEWYALRKAYTVAELCERFRPCTLNPTTSRRASSCIAGSSSATCCPNLAE